MTFKTSLDVVTKRVEYEYDAFDRRIVKNVDADGDSQVDFGERYVYDGLHVALRFDEAGSLTNRYLHGPAIDQVLVDEQVASPSSPGDLLYPLADHLGTVRDLAAYDPAANSGAGETTIANQLVYDSFGQIVNESAPAVDHLFAYTGRERDDDAGLHHYRARWYDPAVGRFLSEDPVKFTAGDANLWRYIGNAPSALVDPLGLFGGPVRTPSTNFQSGAGSWTAQEHLNVAKAAVVGVGEGIGNVFVGAFSQIGETAKQGGDIIVGSAETLTNFTLILCGSNRKVQFPTFSHTHQALDRGQLGLGEYYGEFGANIATLGTYGQGKAIYLYGTGEMSANEASQIIGGTALFQLATAHGMQQQGGVWTAPLESPQTWTATIPNAIGQVPSQLADSWNGVRYRVGWIAPSEEVPIHSHFGMQQFSEHSAFGHLAREAKGSPTITTPRGMVKAPTYEGALGQEGLIVRPSGWPPRGTPAPYDVELAQPHHIGSPCAMVKALGAASQGGGPQPPVVTRGGFIVRDGALFYKAPCRNCTIIIDKNGLVTIEPPFVQPTQVIPPVYGPMQFPGGDRK